MGNLAGSPMRRQNDRMANLAVSIETFYATLTASGFPGSVRPDIFLTSAPAVRSTGEQLRISGGYVVFTLRGSGEEQGFESDLETSILTFTAYALGADNAGAIISAIRFNGQAASVAAGFDNCAALAGFTDGTLLGIFPTRPPDTTQEKMTDKDGRVAFRATMEYRVLVER